MIFQEADARDLPFEDQTFDLACCSPPFDMPEKDITAIFSEARRVAHRTVFWVSEHLAPIFLTPTPRHYIILGNGERLLVHRGHTLFTAYEQWSFIESPETSLAQTGHDIGLPTVYRPWPVHDATSILKRWGGPRILDLCSGSARLSNIAESLGMTATAIDNNPLTFDFAKALTK